MREIDKIINFEKNTLGWLKNFGPGDVRGCVGVSLTSPGEVDRSVAEATAVLYHKLYGAVRDESLADDMLLRLDWSDMGPKPTLRLGPYLFRHVADQLEKP